MISSTKQQQEPVARNLPIVHWAIRDYVHVNPTIYDTGYGDLLQEGRLWLCKAASTYRNDGRVQSSIYAKTVVKNRLLSYCRAAYNRKRKFSRLIIGEHGKLVVDGEALEFRPGTFNTQVSLIETLSLPDACKKDYDGVIRLDIETLALKLQRVQVADIAELYQAPSSHVGA